MCYVRMYIMYIVCAVDYNKVLVGGISSADERQKFIAPTIVIDPDLNSKVCSELSKMRDRECLSLLLALSASLLQLFLLLLLVSLLVSPLLTCVLRFDVCNI